MTHDDLLREKPVPNVPSADQVNAATWSAYGAHHLARGTEIPALNTILWGFDIEGPGTAYLGDVAGRRVLDLGCGVGQAAAHLARDHHAQVTALDSSRTQLDRAETRFGDVPGLTFAHGDATAFLRHTARTWDVIYSCRGALCHTDPAQLLPLIRAGLKPGGRFAASVLHTNDQGHGPSSTNEPRAEQLRLFGADRSETVMRWVLAEDQWQQLLLVAGFTGIQIQLCPSTSPDSAAISLLFRAHRPSA